MIAKIRKTFTIKDNNTTGSHTTYCAMSYSSVLKSKNNSLIVPILPNP